MVLIKNGRASHLTEIQQKKLAKYIWLVNNEVQVDINITISSQGGALSHGGKSYSNKCFFLSMAYGYSHLKRRPTGYTGAMDNIQELAYYIMHDIYGSGHVQPGNCDDFDIGNGNDLDKLGKFLDKNRTKVVFYKGGRSAVNIKSSGIVSWEMQHEHPLLVLDPTVISILNIPGHFEYIYKLGTMDFPQAPYYYIDEINMPVYQNIGKESSVKTKFCLDNTVNPYHKYVCDGYCPAVDIGTVGPTPCDGSHAPPHTPQPPPHTPPPPPKAELHKPCCQIGGEIYPQLRIPVSSPYYQKKTEDINSISHNNSSRSIPQWE